jgi:magnesium transporter
MPVSGASRTSKHGLPPGALIHVGEERTEPVTITVIDYDATELREHQDVTVEACATLLDSPTVSWVNVSGVHQPEIIETLGKSFDLHPLTLEDIMNTQQRPKAEDFERYLFLVLRMPQHDPDTGQLDDEQISLILLPRCVITFQEHEGDVFDPIRTRIRTDKGRIRKEGADYLTYALADAIVDSYFVVLERLGDEVEVIEEELATQPSQESMRTIHALKRQSILLRRSVWPLREVINGLAKGESPLVKESTGIYFRDVYDHTIQVIDSIESIRDLLSGLLDLYISSVSNRMNEVMKVLTVIATMFIPLTFVAGVYGMNFKHMPELAWRWGYPMIWVVMLAAAGAMAAFFRRRKWF